jgi:hypothetical protein
MQVLLLEHGTSAECDVESSLAAAGHEVLRCHEPGDAAFPCVGLLHPGACPLDGGSIAVAVDVSPAHLDYPEHNDGITCAVRRDIPVVRVGDEPDGPIEPYVSRSVRRDDVVAAVETVGTGPLPEHSKVAHAALVDTLERHGFSAAGAWASASRNGVGVKVELASREALPESLRQAAAVRVLAAVNRLDHHAPTVSVMFVPVDDRVAV